MKARRSGTFICARENAPRRTRNGKPYDNLILQDKTGTLDGKVWDPNSQGIAEYDEKDFIEVYGDVISYNGNLQLNIRQIRKAEEGEYNPADYMPTTEKNVDRMLRGTDGLYPPDLEPVSETGAGVLFHKRRKFYKEV